LRNFEEFKGEKIWEILRDDADITMQENLLVSRAPRKMPAFRD
jgi:hypothetical protein